MHTIGFIGLGHMGKPMVLNLLKKGYQVRIYDVIPQAVHELTTHGAIPTESALDAIQDADIIITMVQTGAQVSELCLGETGLFAQAKSGCLFIDCSSIDIATSQRLHQHAKDMGLAMVDSPVSGGVKGAEAASLTFMVGGSEEHFERAKPLLEAMGTKIIHAGPEGNGQAAKICNNMILGISMIAVSEAFALADKLGLDAKKLHEISTNSSGQCWSLTVNPPWPGLVDTAPANHDYAAGFMARMMLKDLLLSQNAAQQVGATTPLGAEATALYTLFVKQGGGEKDFSAIIQLLTDSGLCGE